MTQSARRWMMMVAMAGTLALGAVGCAPQYVNIPAQAGDVASHNANATNVRDIQGQALHAVLRDRPQAIPVGLTLPKGTDPLTYAAVASMAGENVVTPSDGVEPASMLEVQQVRIRGASAEVDVIRPRGETGRQYVTVYLSRSAFAGWSVDRLRAWQGDVQR